MLSFGSAGVVGAPQSAGWRLHAHLTSTGVLDAERWNGIGLFLGHILLVSKVFQDNTTERESGLGF